MVKEPKIHPQLLFHLLCRHFAESVFVPMVLMVARGIVVQEMAVAMVVKTATEMVGARAFVAKVSAAWEEVAAWALDWLLACCPVWLVPYQQASLSQLLRTTRQSLPSRMPTPQATAYFAMSVLVEQEVEGKQDGILDRNQE